MNRRVEPCSVLSIKINYHQNGSILLEQAVSLQLNDLIGMKDFTEESCTEWTYSEEYYRVTGITEFDWVCDKAKIQQMMQVFFIKLKFRLQI